MRNRFRIGIGVFSRIFASFIAGGYFVLLPAQACAQAFPPDDHVNTTSKVVDPRPDSGIGIWKDNSNQPLPPPPATPDKQDNAINATSQQLAKTCGQHSTSKTAKTLCHS